MSKWTVNLSAAVDSSSDEDEDATPQAVRQQHLASDPTEPEATPGDLLGSLNPWSISKMNAPRKDDASEFTLTIDGPSTRVPHEALPGQAVWEGNDGAHTSPGLAGLYPGDMDLAARQPAVSSSFQRAGCAVLAVPYRSPISSPTGEPSRVSREALALVPGTAQGEEGIGLGTPPSTITRTRGQESQMPRARRRPAYQDHASPHKLSSDGFRQAKLALLGAECNRDGNEQSLVDDGDIFRGGWGLEREHITAEDPERDRDLGPTRQRESSGFGDGSPANLRTSGVSNDGWMPSHTPHHRRRPDSRGGGQAGDHALGDAPARTGLDEGDSRCYLMRRQKSMEQPSKTRRPPTLRRMKTDLLPLETTAQGAQTQSLVQVLPIGSESISAAGSRLSWFDKYVLTGVVEEGLDMSMGAEAIEEIEDRLREVFEEWKEDGHGEVEELRIQLKSCLKGKQLAI